MITITLTNDEYCMVRELVRESHADRVAMATSAGWPDADHHIAVAKLLGDIEDSLVAGFAARLDAVRCGA